VILGLDFETYYSTALKYSLKKLNMIEYICDPRFEVIGCAFREDHDEPYWVDGPDVGRHLQSFNWELTTVVGHNLQFDASIASWVYGIHPKLWFCTLAAARTLWQHRLKYLSLAKLAEHFGFPAKGTTVMKVDGMTRQMIIEAGLYDEYVDYCLHDVTLSVMLYELAKDHIPIREIVLADSVLRLTTEPRLMLNYNKLGAHLLEVRASKEQSMALAMFAGINGKDDLMSNDRFAQALMNLGVDPPRKISVTTGKRTWAFAKSDPDFKELLNHENNHVQNLVAARLGHKSTLDETRAERLIKTAGFEFPQWGQHILPVPLKVSGAHTHRLSGDAGLNLQNLRRGGLLREAIEAPEGHQIVAGDLSQIEARMNAVFCGQLDLIEQFRTGQDPYSIMASRVFGRTVTKADIGERFIGKKLVLSAGYGVGHVKYHATLRHDSMEQLGEMLDIDLAEAQRQILAYRAINNNIANMWAKLGNIIPEMTSVHTNFQLGPVVFQHEAIQLPSGLHLHYHNLRLDHVSNNWLYDYAGRPKRIYGPKLLENIIQALARIVIMDAMVTLRRQLKDYDAHWVHQVHDELVYLVPDDAVDAFIVLLEGVLTTPPVWMPTLPLACEIGFGTNYGECK
jgi:DNA polymerase